MEKKKAVFTDGELAQLIVNPERNQDFLIFQYIFLSSLYGAIPKAQYCRMTGVSKPSFYKYYTRFKEKTEQLEGIEVHV